jgi:hypothetical protein
LELTSSETSLEEQNIVWDSDFWKHRHKAGYEPQNRYFGLEITESFSEIYSKIIEKAIPESQFTEIILTR